MNRPSVTEMDGEIDFHLESRRKQEPGRKTSKFHMYSLQMLLGLMSSAEYSSADSKRVEGVFGIFFFFLLVAGVVGVAL